MSFKDNSKKRDDVIRQEEEFKQAPVPVVKPIVKSKITMENFIESYKRLIVHLINRRLMPNPELNHILEPLGFKMEAGSPGVWIYDGDEERKP